MRKPNIDRSGFTLIEMLIVIVIVGIIAAIVVPRLFVSKERAHLASMKSDLRNVAAAQEAYLSHNGTYTATLSQLEIRTTKDVAITLSIAGGSGWAASASHPGVPQTCALFHGTIAPLSPATAEGVLRCEVP